MLASSSMADRIYRLKGGCQELSVGENGYVQGDDWNGVGDDESG